MQRQTNKHTTTTKHNKNINRQTNVDERIKTIINNKIQIKQQSIKQQIKINKRKKHKRNKHTHTTITIIVKHINTQQTNQDTT